MLFFFKRSEGWGRGKKTSGIHSWCEYLPKTISPCEPGWLLESVWSWSLLTLLLTLGKLIPDHSRREDLRRLRSRWGAQHADCHPPSPKRLSPSFILRSSNLYRFPDRRVCPGPSATGHGLVSQEGFSEAPRPSSPGGDNLELFRRWRDPSNHLAALSAR